MWPLLPYADRCTPTVKTRRLSRRSFYFINLLQSSVIKICLETARFLQAAACAAAGVEERGFRFFRYCFSSCADWMSPQFPCKVPFQQKYMGIQPANLTMRVKWTVPGCICSVTWQSGCRRATEPLPLPIENSFFTGRSSREQAWMRLAGDAGPDGRFRVTEAGCTPACDAGRHEIFAVNLGGAVAVGPLTAETEDPCVAVL